MLRFKFQNIGPISQATLDLHDLTIVTGKNNTGKTYVSYSVFECLLSARYNLSYMEFYREIADHLLNGEEYVVADVMKFCREHKSLCLNTLNYGPHVESIAPLTEDSSAVHAGFLDFDLDDLSHEVLEQKARWIRRGWVFDPFSINLDESGNKLSIRLSTKIETDVEIDQSYVNYKLSYFFRWLLWGGFFPWPQVLCSERHGITLFLEEFRRSRVKSNGVPRPIYIIYKSRPSPIHRAPDTYALAVGRGVEFTEEGSKHYLPNLSSGVDKPFAALVSKFDSLVGGKYGVDSTGVPVFVSKEDQDRHVPLADASSSVRALLDLRLWIERVFATNKWELPISQELLVIDEPELNLHPSSQREMARLIARIVNVGVKVFVTTHSDTFIRELNTLIVLSKQDRYREEVMERYGYEKEELLDPQRVGAYTTVVDEDSSKDGSTRYTLKHIPTSDRVGIEIKSFDDTIEKINEIQYAIYYGVDDY